jgi:hypothetical protein
VRWLSRFAGVLCGEKTFDHRGSQRNLSLMSRVLDHQGVEQLVIRGPAML